jgi:hypothetical protein
MADSSPVGICRIAVSRSTGHLRMRGCERSSRLSRCPGIVTCRMHAGSPKELSWPFWWSSPHGETSRPGLVDRGPGGCPRSPGFEHRASADRERGRAQRPPPLPAGTATITASEPAQQIRHKQR